jgi:peptide/nickel transport system substrate-binding protein
MQRKEDEMSKKETLHPAISDLKIDLDKGKLTRRDFLRYATLLGMSAAAASQMAGLVWPKKVFAATPVRGGTLKVAGQVHKITHPAQFSWVAPTQVGRQVAEYLTFTDGKNITHPYLLKNWQVSDDMKTWTLNLREGVKWNNGDTFTADDVIFNFNQWMNKDVGSSMLGLVGEYLDLSGIEKVDQYQVKLHLKRPEIGVPENLFHYPALIMNHRRDPRSGFPRTSSTTRPLS